MNFAEVLTSQQRSCPEPCSACAKISAAAKAGLAVISASTNTSLGPGNKSMDTRPTNSRFAATTYALPGPKTFCTGARVFVP